MSLGLQQTPRMLTARGRPTSQAQTCEVTSVQAALLALREEHVRLREANILLREKEMARRQELEQLKMARQAATADLQHIKMSLEIEREELQGCRSRRATLRSKLDRAYEAISRAVASVDRLYETGEAGAKQDAEQAQSNIEQVSEMIADDEDSEVEPPPKVTADKYHSSGENSFVKKMPVKGHTWPKLLQQADDGAVRAPLRALNVI